MKCSKCGNELTIDTSKVLTSIPPKYEAYCETCNKMYYIACDKYRGYLWDSKTYVPEGDLKDKTLEEVDDQTDKGNLGWICPKCKSVLAPWQRYCPFCSEGNNYTITF